MNKPTLDILDAISPEYNQYQGILPHTARYNEYTSQFSLNNQSWTHHFSLLSGISFNWNEIKYADVVMKKISIEEACPDSIGVYMFMVRAQDLINNLPRFVYYIGIAGANDSNRTLRNRLRDYFAESQLKKRDQVRILIFKHYENVYIGFSEITLRAGQTLENIEKSLIGFFGTHLLANRDDIPIELQPQGKAFNI